jgi:hypothetical protein
MDVQDFSVKESIGNLSGRIAQADHWFWEYIHTTSDYANPSWEIELCFIQLQAIAEALGLEQFRKMIEVEYSDRKSSKHGLLESGITPDGDPYSIALSKIRQFANVLESFFPGSRNTLIEKELLHIIRDVHYVITDKSLFHTTPSSEKDVHLRIEGILKCVFPDLKHKPSLTKQIKNFEPDTGIPSIETLIEYKFLSSKDDVGAIADEILADTRGYSSKDWKHFVYVIYETHRFRTEKDWNLFIDQSGVVNTTVVVLSGVPPKSKKKSHSSKQ